MMYNINMLFIPFSLHINMGECECIRFIYTFLYASYFMLNKSFPTYSIPFLTIYKYYIH